MAALVLTAEPGVVEPGARAAPEPEPIEASAAIPAEPSPAGPARTIDHEPDRVAEEDCLSPPPSFAEATDAAVTVTVESARDEVASTGDPVPQEAAMLYEPAPAEPIEPVPTEPTSVETTPAELPAADPDREPAVPHPPVMHQVPPPLLDLIPQVLPSPSKPRSLSPSVAPALRPVQVEPVLQREPDAPQPMEPVAPPSEPLARAEISPAAPPAEPVQASPPALVVASPAVAPRVDAHRCCSAAAGSCAAASLTRTAGRRASPLALCPACRARLVWSWPSPQFCWC